MAIPPILGSLIPILTRRDDLLEIARNVYVAPSDPEGPPAPSPGLLADLSPDEARGLNRVSRVEPGSAGPEPVADRSDADPAPVPSLIGLRAPRMPVTTPMSESAEPRLQDPSVPTARPPVFPRAAARDAASGPAESPADPTGRPARVAADAPVPRAGTDPFGIPSAGRPGAENLDDLPNAARPAAPILGPSDPAPAGIVPGRAGAAASAPAATESGIGPVPDAASAFREAPDARRDVAHAPLGNATPHLSDRQPSHPRAEPGPEATVDDSARGHDPVRSGAAVEGRPSPPVGNGSSASARAAEFVPLSEPAAFADGGRGAPMERAGIIASCILNAAMIPGWPPPRAFAVPRTEELLTRFGQIGAVPTEADLLAFLKRNGRPPSRLARLRQRLAKLTKSRRLRTLLGLAALMATIEAVLEAVEAELGLLARLGDDPDEPGAGEEQRRHLRI